MLTWKGVSTAQVTQLEQQHGRADVASLVDLLRWSLDADPLNRPSTIQAMLDHAFFNPESGTLRVDSAVQRLRELLADHTAERGCCKVMLSYCWEDTNWVLGMLAPELAVNCSSLWLDRLGGEQGMGEWAVDSMQRGVDGADVVVAVVSPAYIQSMNCGREMAMAVATGTAVLPVVLGVPFSAWPPTEIGGTPMTDQFQSTNGDLKIFVDMSNYQADFHTKLQKELLPRLAASLVRGTNVNPAEAALAAIAKSDNVGGAPVPATSRASRPGAKKPTSKSRSRVAPSAEAALADANTAPEEGTRGSCSICALPVMLTQAREVGADGAYRHMDCSAAASAPETHG